MTLLEKIDEKLLYAANKAVHAYNWATGGTKSELANDLASFATISSCSGSLCLGPIWGLIAASIWLPCTHYLQNENTKIEELERKAQESECLNLTVEKRKQERIGHAHFHMGIASITTSGILFSNQIEHVAANCSLSIGIYAYDNAGLCN